MVLVVNSYYPICVLNIFFRHVVNKVSTTGVEAKFHVFKWSCFWETAKKTCTRVSPRISS